MFLSVFCFSMQFGAKLMIVDANDVIGRFVGESEKVLFCIYIFFVC